MDSTPIHRAAFAVLAHHAGGGEETSIVAIVPEEARTERAAFVARLFGPAVMIRIVAGLVVPAADERESRGLAQLVRKESDEIAAAERGLIDQQLRLIVGSTRSEIQHAGERRRASTAQTPRP